MKDRNKVNERRKNTKDEWKKGRMKERELGRKKGCRM
jgi:hypothetical protein